MYKISIVKVEKENYLDKSWEVVGERPYTKE